MSTNPDSHNKNPQTEASEEGEDVGNSRDKRGKTKMDLLIIAFGGLAVISAGFLSVFSYLGYWQNKETWALWSLYLLTIFTITAGFLVWQKRVNEQVAQRPPFEISISTQFGVEKRSLNLGAMWFRWAFPQTPVTISPIHRLIVIRFTNRQTVRSQIERYAVEGETPDGRWVRFQWMQLDHGGTLYLLPTDQTKAFPVTLKTLDRQMQDHSIAPDETIQGWAFFELPEDVAMSCRLRIYVKDYGGAEMTETIEGAPVGFGQNTSIEKTFGDTVDFTKATSIYYSDRRKDRLDDPEEK